MEREEIKIYTKSVIEDIKQADYNDDLFDQG